MKKYLHIGYPKNLSTTLQNNFFSQHPELLHLGIGCNGENLEYINDDLSIYMESLLRARDIEFENIKNEFSKSIKNSIDRIIGDNYKYYGISHENLSIHFSNDEVDITQKINRLYCLFGDNTKVIVVIRNQFDLIKSLYKESLKAGLSIDFSSYVENLYMGKMHSYLQELQYSNVLDLYSAKFGKRNILVLPLESYKLNGVLSEFNHKISLISDICSFMDINYHHINLEHKNVSISDEEAFQLVKINKHSKFGLSKGNYSPIDVHKYKNIFEYYEYEHACLYSEVNIKRKNVEKAKNIAKNDNRKLDYHINPNILKKLKGMYLDSNNALADKYNIALPNSYSDMEF